MEIPFFFASASTRSMISFSDSLEEMTWDRIWSVSALREVTPRGFARAPLAIGDQGMTLQSAREKYDVPHAKLFTRRKHFSFFFSINKIVIVLHADELGPTVFLGYVLHSKKLICMHRGSADITDFTHLNKIWDQWDLIAVMTMKRLHCLLSRSFVIITVNLKDINVIRLQPLKTCFNSFKNMLPTETLFINVISWVGFVGKESRVQRIVCKWEETFCQNNQLLARNIVLLDGFADYFFWNALTSIEFRSWRI